MARLTWLVLILTTLSAAAGARVTDPDLRRELLRLEVEDQKARAAALANPQDPAVIERVKAADRKSAERLRALLDAGGWPTRSRVRDDGARAAWLLVQHADHDPALQRRCLDAMRALIRSGEVFAADVAYLTDRVLLQEGRPQQYGTQFQMGEGGEYVPRPIEDVANVNLRRRMAGLGPLSEYAALLNRFYRSGGRAEPEPVARVVDFRRIWDAAPHNAFADLLRWKDRWWCVFREGQAHVSPDGALRVIASRDGRSWESMARITEPGSDLRDAKLTRTPDGRLMLSGAAALAPGGPHHHQSLAWFSRDGRQWSSPSRIGDPDFWLWRVTWRGKTAYSIGYATAGKQQVRLYRSRDGRKWETLVPTLFDQDYPNEHALEFEEDGRAYCLLRRDGGRATAQLGTASPPYTDWRWKDLGVRIGGPALLRLPDGRLIAGVRLYDRGTRTAICLLDPDAGTLAELVALPSAGDTSYPGLVWHRDRLWVSYYSSHEEKTAIYLAQVDLPPDPKKSSKPIAISKE